MLNLTAVTSLTRFALTEMTSLMKDALRVNVRDIIDDVLLSLQATKCDVHAVRAVLPVQPAGAVQRAAMQRQPVLLPDVQPLFTLREVPLLAALLSALPGPVPVLHAERRPTAVPDKLQLSLCGSLLPLSARRSADALSVETVPSPGAASVLLSRRRRYGCHRRKGRRDS